MQHAWMALDWTQLQLCIIHTIWREKNCFIIYCCVQINANALNSVLAVYFCTFVFPAKMSEHQNENRKNRCVMTFSESIVSGDDDAWQERLMTSLLQIHYPATNWKNLQALFICANEQQTLPHFIPSRPLKMDERKIRSISIVM